MSYQVEISKRAETDLDRVLATLAESSPKASLRLARSFWKGVQRLRAYPHGCGLAYEFRYFSEELRHLLFFANARKKYQALFVVRESAVHILCIRAPGQKPVKPQDIMD
jgi:plasmid stabilization system protein ParE